MSLSVRYRNKLNRWRDTLPEAKRASGWRVLRVHHSAHPSLCRGAATHLQAQQKKSEQPPSPKEIALEITVI